MKPSKQLLRVEKVRIRSVLGIAFALVALSVGAGVARASDESTVRWDIINVDFSTGTASAGGIASARANDNSKITVTGSGTFKVEDGQLEDATGGGSWTTFNASNVVTDSGTYQVTGAVRWEPAPGTPALPNDNIGNRADTRAGLVVLRIRYSDGSAGILVVSCHLAGTPDAVFEGITASKGFVDYWNREAPPAPPGNANRTTFHVTTEDEQ